MGVEVAGKQFDGQPHCIEQGFHGEPAGPNVQVQPSSPGEVTIEDRKIACRRQQVELSGPDGRTVVTVYFSDSEAPYILKRESTTTAAAGGGVLAESSQEVIALDMPFKLGAEMRNSACVKTIQKSPKGAVTSLAVSMSDIPGGVVYQTAKETDKSGRLVRRSMLEVVAYGTQAEEERQGLFGRKRASRSRKPPHGK